MTSGIFTKGETVEAVDPSGNRVAIFRIAQPDHKLGDINSPSEVFNANPYDTSSSLGSTYSASGSGVTMAVGDNAGQVGGLGTLTDGVGQGSIATATQTSTGGAYSFSQSFIEGDAIVTTAPTVGAVSAYSDQVSTAVGSGTGTGTVTSAHAITAVGGGTGTVTTGQFVTELLIN